MKEIGKAWSFQNALWNRNQKCPTHDDRLFLTALQKLFAGGDAAKQSRFSEAVRRTRGLVSTKRMPDNDAVANVYLALSGIQAPTASLVQLDEEDQSDEGYFVEEDQLDEEGQLDEEQQKSVSLVQLNESHLIKGWKTVVSVLISGLVVLALFVVFFATIGWVAILLPILYALGLADYFTKERKK